MLILGSNNGLLILEDSALDLAVVVSSQGGLGLLGEEVEIPDKSKRSFFLFRKLKTRR